jgi:SAM-dependent methyltransferase
MIGLLDGLAPRSGLILDLGCGYGEATHWLAQITDQRTFFGVDYDESKIRVAQRTAPESKRIRFECGDILDMDYPSCDVILLLDVLHYWQPQKQQLILNKARRALRPGGRLVLRDAARAENAAHGRVDFWEQMATRFGHNKANEGLHFRSLDELMASLGEAGFARWEINQRESRTSNVLIAAYVD